MGEGLKEKTQQGRKNISLIIIGGLVVIIALLVVVIVMFARRTAKAPDTQAEGETRRSVVVTQDTAESIVDDLLQDNYVEPGYYSVSMNTTWHFATGDSVSEDAFVENLAENTNDVYFDVFLADNEDEAIYKSPVLPRGSELDEITLDTALEAGTYDCVMVYHLVDEDQNTVSTLRVAFDIIVGE